MPQSIPDSLLQIARPRAGGTITPKNGIGDTITYEVWATGVPSDTVQQGWIEIYRPDQTDPLQLAPASIPLMLDATERQFGESELLEEAGIAISDDGLAVVLKQEWGLGLVFGLALAIAAMLTATALLFRTRRQAAVFQTIARHEMASREAERARVAREIHDGPLQEIAALARKADGEGGPLREVAAELRALAAGLRPPALEEFGLGPALEDLSERHADSPLGLQVRVDVSLPPGSRLPPDAELGLYRVAQEALTNAATKGHARTAWVFLRPLDEGIQLVIRDDGRGLPEGITTDSAGTRALVAAGHFGLAGMVERADHLAGTLTVSNGPGGIGTEVILVAPVTGSASSVLTLHPVPA